MEQNLEDLNVNLQTMSQNAQEHYEELQNQMRSSFGESYKNAIETWTIRDPKKRHIAIENRLNWLEFFTFKDFLNWFNNLS